MRRALVRRELERKPDFIKVWFIHQKGDDLAAQEAIVKAAGDAAHARGVRLACMRPSLSWPRPRSEPARFSGALGRGRAG